MASVKSSGAEPPKPGWRTTEFWLSFAAVAVGTVIASGYVASGGQVRGGVSRQTSFRYPLSLDRAGAVRANGTLSLLVTGITGTSATRATINYAEVR